MKRIPAIIKLAVVVMFAINAGLTGILAYIWEEYQKQSEKVVFIDPSKEIQLWKVLQDRLEAAKAKVQAKLEYTIEDYRKDLDFYQEKKRELGIPDECNCHNFGTTFGRLQILMPTRELKKGQQSVRNVYEPIRKNTDWGWVSDYVPGYLLSFYKNSFLLALLLFGTWYWERRKYPAPLYFLLLVVAYPITIAFKFVRFWQAKSEIQSKAEDMYFNLTSQKYRYVVVNWIDAETEVRRRDDDLFRTLSDEEAEKIKKFSLGLISKAELIAQLGVPKYGFWIALVVTLFVTALPSRVAFQDGPSLEETATVTQAFSDHLARDSIDDGGGKIQVDPAKIFWEPLAYDPLPGWSRWHFAEAVFRIPKIVTEIFHVPKSPAVSQ